MHLRFTFISLFVLCTACAPVEAVLTPNDVAANAADQTGRVLAQVLSSVAQNVDYDVQGLAEDGSRVGQFYWDPEGYRQGSLQGRFRVAHQEEQSTVTLRAELEDFGTDVEQFDGEVVIETTFYSSSEIIVTTLDGQVDSSRRGDIEIQLDTESVDHESSATIDYIGTVDEFEVEGTIRLKDDPDEYYEDQGCKTELGVDCG